MRVCCGREDVQMTEEHVVFLEEPDQACTGMAEESHADGVALPACATAGPDAAAAPIRDAPVEGEEGVAGLPAQAEEGSEGPGAPVGEEAGVEPGAVEAAGEAPLVVVDVVEVEEVAAEGECLSELGKLAINASIDEEVRSSLVECACSVHVGRHPEACLCNRGMCLHGKVFFFSQQQHLDGDVGRGLCVKSCSVAGTLAPVCGGFEWGSCVPAHAQMFILLRGC